MLKALLALVFLGTSAVADDWSRLSACPELWFSRNATMDDAGYCFSTNLGKAVFDNSDCTTTAPELGPLEKELVGIIREREVWLECNLDTSQSSIDLMGESGLNERIIAMRKLLDWQPVVPDFDSGSACIDYFGEPEMLYSYPDLNAEVLGTIHPGDSITFLHVPDIVIENWEFASLVWRDKELVGMGWTTNWLGTEKRCRIAAG